MLHGEVSIQVAVYGGSFNPPHVVHAMVSSWLLWTGKVEKVLLVPVYQHAFEGIQDKTLAPFQTRLDWCQCMTTDVDARIQVSDVESQLPSPSYTIDTLRFLAKTHPEDRFRIVIGADVLPQLSEWKNWEAIQQEFAPIVVGRAGYPIPDEAVVFPGVSSSEIRRRVRQGSKVSHLVTRNVAAALKTQPTVFGHGNDG